MATSSGLWHGNSNDTASNLIDSNSFTGAGSWTKDFPVNGAMLRIQTTGATKFTVRIIQANSGSSGIIHHSTTFTLPGAYNGYPFFAFADTTPGLRYIIEVRDVVGAAVKWFRSSSKYDPLSDSYLTGTGANYNYSFKVRESFGDGFEWDGLGTFSNLSPYSVDSVPKSMAFTRDYAVDAVSVFVATYGLSNVNAQFEIYEIPSGGAITPYDLRANYLAQNVVDNSVVEWELPITLKANVRYLLRVSNPLQSAGTLAIWGTSGRADTSVTSYTNDSVLAGSLIFKTRQKTYAVATKRWDGTTWIKGSIKRYDGTIWVTPNNIVKLSEGGI